MRIESTYSCMCMCVCVEGPWRLNGQHMSLAPVVCAHYLAQFTFIRGLKLFALQDLKMALDDL